jgi:hypothetical protein
MALLQQAVESQHRAEALADENAALREELARKFGILQRLQKLTVAAASLLGSVNAAVTEPSSLQILAKLPSSAAVTPPPDADDDHNMKMVVGKYLGRLMSLIADNLRSNAKDLNVLALFQIEAKLNGMFKFAEERQIIPTTEPDAGWKKGMLAHHELFTQLKQALQDGDAGEEDADDEP